MILLVDDLLRLADMGFSGFYEFRDGFYRLRNINNRCYFLGTDNHCQVYPQRPLGCRVYPMIYVEGEGVALDPECPLSIALSEKDLIEHFALLREFLKKLRIDYGVEFDLYHLEKSFERLLVKRNAWARA